MGSDTIFRAPFRITSRLATQLAIRASQKSPISTVSRQWPSLQPTGYCAIVLFEFELDEFETRGPCVLDRTRLARILPDEVTVVGRHAAVGVPRNDFGEHAAMDIDAQAWSRLRDLSC